MVEAANEVYEEPAAESDAPDTAAFEAELEAQAESFLAAVPWWVVLLQGIAVLLLGVMLITQAKVTTVVLVTFFGWYWLIHGGFEIASLFWDRTQWGWRVLSGVLGILAGLYVIGSPLMGAAIVLGVATISLGINGVVIGASSLAKAFSGGGWGVGIFGALSVIIGLSIAFNFPRYMLALPWVWGVMAAVAGVMSIAGAFRIKKLQAEAA